MPAAAEPFDFASELIACGLRVCVLGGGQAGASLAWALAARLARLPATRCATLCSAAADAGPVPARPPGPPAPARSTARRLARCLVADGHHAAVRGRVVQALLPDSPEVTRELFAAIDARAPGTPTLTVLPGVRHPGFDALVAGQDLILVVVAAGAPPSLCALAVAELAALAPHATVQAVPLPARHSAGARRAAVGRALKALR